MPPLMVVLIPAAHRNESALLVIGVNIVPVMIDVMTMMTARPMLAGAVRT
jgi:hypothetical protein